MYFIVYYFNKDIPAGVINQWLNMYRLYTKCDKQWCHQLIFTTTHLFYVQIVANDIYNHPHVIITFQYVYVQSVPELCIIILICANRQGCEKITQFMPGTTSYDIKSPSMTKSSDMTADK